MALHRREFLQSALVGTSVIGFQNTAPAFFSRVATNVSNQDRILVVIQLSGGNDGLNTVVPYENDVYYKSRPKLAIPKNDVLKINDEYGFHPVLTGFNHLLEEGQLSIVQGIGYPNPNRSHFESMDIWHTCHRKHEERSDGWLGRTIEQLSQSVSGDIPGVHLGEKKQPFALRSRQHRVPSIRSIEQFRLQHQEQRETSLIKELAGSAADQSDSLLGFVQSSTTTALDVSEQLQKSNLKSKTGIEYPESNLASQLKTVAQMIDSGIGARIYYLELDGFDTHAFQPGSHQALLRELGDAVETFQKDLKSRSQTERVLTVCFSEFGRRVAENASDGTDHGTAAPMFLIGEGLKSGQQGKHPSLDDLQQGDLKYHTDFRQVYATLLEQWFQCDSKAILAGHYEPVDLFA